MQRDREVEGHRPTGLKRAASSMAVVFALVVAVLVTTPDQAAGATPLPSANGAPAPQAPFLGPAPRWPLPVDAPGRLDLHRDCGFTAPLRDGRVLWIFCDTAGTTAHGAPIHPWLDNTAALAETGAPTATLDVTDSRGHPTQFVEVSESPCPNDRPVHRVWPLSATTVPDAGSDQVYVYFEHACGVPGQGIGSVVSMGMGLARWTYTPGVTSVGSPISATVLAQRLFDGSWDGTGTPTDGGFGRASAYSPADRLLYLYRCHSAWGVADWGCEVGRVPVDDAADRDAYRFRSAAGSWDADVTHAAPVSIDGVTPGSGYQITWYPQLGRWALVNMAWPGIGSLLVFRMADQPWGPWSAPTEVPLPSGSCRPVHCYAVYGHPGLDVPGSLAFTFYDPAVTQVRFIRLAMRDHRFWDVPPSHTFFTPIEELGDQGVVRGDADGAFRPTAAISRQAMAAMLYRIAGSPWGPEPGCLSRPAPDVTTSNPFCGAIRWMLDQGISTGDADGRFRPAAPISRQAAAAFLARMVVGVTVVQACTDTPFGDVGPAHTFCGSIAWMVKSGIATGYADGTFGPTVPVSRQAVAAFLHRLPAEPDD